MMGGICVGHRPEPFTEADMVALKEAAEPLHTFLNKNGDPHSVVIVTQDGVQFLSGEMFSPFEVMD